MGNIFRIKLIKLENVLLIMAAIFMLVSPIVNSQVLKDTVVLQNLNTEEDPNDKMYIIINIESYVISIPKGMPNPETLLKNIREGKISIEEIGGYTTINPFGNQGINITFESAVVKEDLCTVTTNEEGDGSCKAKKPAMSGIIIAIFPGNEEYFPSSTSTQWIVMGKPPFEKIVDEDWLIIFLFIGILVAGLYAMGKSPLAAFDVTTPRTKGPSTYPSYKIKAVDTGRIWRTAKTAHRGMRLSLAAAGGTKLLSLIGTSDRDIKSIKSIKDKDVRVLRIYDQLVKRIPVVRGEMEEREKELKRLKENMEKQTSAMIRKSLENKIREILATINFNKKNLGEMLTTKKKIRVLELKKLGPEKYTDCVNKISHEKKLRSYLRIINNKNLSLMKLLTLTTVKEKGKETEKDLFDIINKKFPPEYDTKELNSTLSKAALAKAGLVRIEAAKILKIIKNGREPSENDWEEYNKAEEKIDKSEEKLFRSLEEVKRSMLVVDESISLAEKEAAKRKEENALDNMMKAYLMLRNMIDGLSQVVEEERYSEKELPFIPEFEEAAVLAKKEIEKLGPESMEIIINFLKETPKVDEHTINFTTEELEKFGERSVHGLKSAGFHLSSEAKSNLLKKGAREKLEISKILFEIAKRIEEEK